MPRVVKIMRGIPGSGKTTYARALFPGGLILSADDWFTSPDGEYRCDDAQRAAAHADCRTRFLRALGREESLIVVDNRSIRRWEIEGYLVPAQMRGYDVEIITVFCPLPLALHRNIHRVPGQQVRWMERLRKCEEARFPAAWNHKMVHAILIFSYI